MQSTQIDTQILEKEIEETQLKSSLSHYEEVN